MVLNCKEVAESISGDQLLKTGSWHRLAVWIHLLMCRKCRSYQEQMRTIGAAARKVWRSQPDETTVLDRIEEQILKDVTAGSGRGGAALKCNSGHSPSGESATLGASGGHCQVKLFDDIIGTVFQR